MTSPNRALANASLARFQTYPHAFGASGEEDFFELFDEQVIDETAKTTRVFSQAFKDLYGDGPLGHYEEFELFMARVVSRLQLRPYHTHTNNYARTRVPAEVPLGRKDMETGYVQTVFKKSDEMTPVMISQLIGIEPWVRSIENARSWIKIALKRALDRRNTPERETYWATQRAAVTAAYGAIIDIAKVDMEEEDLDADASIEATHQRQLAAEGGIDVDGGGGDGQDGTRGDDYSDFIDLEASPGFASPGDVADGVASVRIAGEDPDRMEQ